MALYSEDAFKKSLEDALIQFKSFKIEDDEWEKAEKILSEKLSSESKSSIDFKIDKKEHPSLKHSFLYIDGKLYCLDSNKSYLGKGQWGLVKLAVDRNGTKAVVKVLKKSQTNEQSQHKKDWEVEIEEIFKRNLGSMKRNISTKNLTKEMEDFFKEYQLKPFLGVELKKFIPLLSKTEKYEIIDALIDQLTVLQKNKIVHADLHSRNVLIMPTNDGTSVSLIDFGNSRIIPDGQETLALQGDPVNRKILPPEIVTYKAGEKDEKFRIKSVYFDEVPNLENADKFFYDIPIVIKDKHNDLWIYGTEPAYFGKPPDEYFPVGNLKLTKVADSKPFDMLSYEETPKSLDEQSLSEDEMAEIYNSMRELKAHTPFRHTWTNGNTTYYSLKTDLYSLGLLCVRELGLDDQVFFDLLNKDPSKRPSLAETQQKIRELRAAFRETRSNNP